MRLVLEWWQREVYNYPFPGNIRELENLIIGLYTFYNDEISLNDLDDEIINPKFETSSKLADVERLHIINVFNSCDGNISKSTENWILAEIL